MKEATKLFERMLTLPGAIAALTRTLINHVISDVALERITDETRAKAALYNAIFEETNDDHCKPAEMYETMADRAPKGDSIMSKMRVSEEQWNAFGGKTKVLGLRQIKASFAGVMELRLGPSDIKAYEKLSEFTRRELLVATEKSLISASDRYAEWVAERPNAVNMRRAANTDAALAVVPGLITAYEKDSAVNKALTEATAAGRTSSIRSQIAA